MPKHGFTEHKTEVHEATFSRQCASFKCWLSQPCWQQHGTRILRVALPLRLCRVCCERYPSVAAACGSQVLAKGPALLSPQVHPTTSLSPLLSATLHKSAEASAVLLLLLHATVCCPCCLQRSISLQRHQADSEAHLLEESRAAQAALQEQLRTLQGQFAAKQEAEQAASSELGRLRQQLSAAQSAAATSESARQQLGAQLQAAQQSVELLQQQVTQCHRTGHSAVPARPNLPALAISASPAEWSEHLCSCRFSCCRCGPSADCSLC